MQDSEARAVLGLPLDATRAEAQRAFRRLARQTHPDAGGDAAAFRAVVGAWAELGATLPPSLCPVSLSPHALAYRAEVSRVVWAERRPPVRQPALRLPALRRDFAAVLAEELARRAA
jgi:hypothetical protein